MKREYRLLLVVGLSSGLLSLACASGEMVGGSGKGGSTGSGSGGRGGSSSTTGSGGSSSTTGSGGSFGTGTGGTSATTGSGGTFGTGTGGTFGTGTGGSFGTGTGGTSATTGSGGISGNTCTPTAPTAALLTDFATTMPGTAPTVFTFMGGTLGGVTTFGGAAGPTVSATGGAMHVTMNTAGAAMPQYVGAVMYFNGCVDASLYKGVKFKIGGTMTGCTMQYAANDSAHSTPMPPDLKGTCVAASCYPPQKTIDVIPATPTEMTVLWADAINPGSPATAIDPFKIMAVQWQFTVPMGAGTCSANITIDDVSFAQ